MTLADRHELPGTPAELTLELARRSHEPTTADRARNLAALRGRLGLPAPLGSPPVSNPVPPLRPPAPAAASRGLGLAPWQQLVGVGVLTGAMGFFLGLGVSERASSEPVGAPLDAALQQAPAPSAVTAPRDARPELAAVTAETAVPARSALQGSPRPAGAPPERARSVVKRSVPRQSVATPSVAERSDPELIEAVRLLGRARRALERQEPALALGLLDELDARFARELLDEERSATRVLALCAGGEPAAALELARGWLVDRPRSIYARRLEQSCARAALRSR